MRNVLLLGASGSIGTQSLDILEKHPERFTLRGFSLGKRVHMIPDFLKRFPSVEYLCVSQAEDAENLRKNYPNLKIYHGDDGLVSIIEECPCDMVVNALVGFAGMVPSVTALRHDKILCLANKESLVVVGDLLMPLARPGRLIPVDSEHSAIYQCLVGEHRSNVHRIWLTCSGGPFYGMGREELSHVSAAMALKHPTWAMGAKITIDSATLMNKGLEVLEAHHLFDVPVDMVNVLVHPQSMVHSMVEFEDGVVKAQLGPSDMRIPIQYALSYPERWETPAPRVDYCAAPDFTFGRADEDAFGCLRLAKEAGRAGGTMPCAMNAANEVANLAFRQGRCGFLDVEATVAHVMGKTEVAPVESLPQLEEVDARSRELAASYLDGACR